MIIMKQLQITILLAVLMCLVGAIFLSSCSSDNEEVRFKDLSYSLTLADRESHEFTCDWKTYEMPKTLCFILGQDLLNTPRKWRIICDAPWITFDKKEGENGLGTTCYIQDNTGPEDRWASLTLYIDEGYSDNPIVNIYQYGYNHYIDYGVTVLLHVDSSEMEEKTLALSGISFREVVKADWGDGSVEFFNTDDESLMQALSHKYKKSGGYYVKLQFGVSFNKDGTRQPQFGFTIHQNGGLVSVSYSSRVSYGSGWEKVEVSVDNKNHRVRVSCDEDRNITVEER